MSIITINLANKEFKISYNDAKKDQLSLFVQSLDAKLQKVIKDNSLAPLELVLIIVSLKLEEKIAILEEKNLQLLKSQNTESQIIMDIQNRLEDIYSNLNQII